jgi:adenylosuccinate synthase
MKNIAILGASQGDEAKGRVTHDFSPNYDWIVRFGGGANAGHTIYRDGKKYVHNLMPSFDWRSPRPKAFLGSGMVIDMQQLLKEVKDLYQVDSSFPSRVYVDPDAFLVLPEHKEEDKRSNGHIGSTNRGIGPAYKYKIARCSYRIRDIAPILELYPTGYLIYQELKDLGVNFISSYQLRDKFATDNILFEGAQGVLLDINHGIYPYVSCGDATVAGIYANGFAHTKLDKVYGVSKCYTTKVGEGPFPTEANQEDTTILREKGKEYGATTGRPRRIGWLDLPALQYACYKGGIQELIVTKFDVLEGMETVPVCTSYQTPVTCSKDFFTAKPEYIQVQGWKNSKNLSELSPFIDLIQEYTTCKVSYISCGVNKEDLIPWHQRT